MELPSPARDLLESSALAHLVTLNEDGSPHVVVVWVGLDQDEIVIGHLGRPEKPPRQGWVYNIAQDPRVALSIQEYRRKNALGSYDYIVFHGRANIEEGGAAELLWELKKVYGAESAVRSRLPGWVVRIQVERITGVGVFEPA